MITISDLSKSYGDQTLFSDGCLQLDAGRRYGVVGANGSGKSTFLRILAGMEEPSTGEVIYPRKTSVGTLSQDHFKYEDTPIIDVVMMGNQELWDAIQAKEKILANAENEFDAERYSLLEDIILRHDGYEMEVRAAQILEGLKIPSAVHHEPMSTLSGGFKLRVLLGQTLASNPKVLLLDEPTNHLDILSMRWLEVFLCGFKGCVVIVSHDHRFLDNVCTDIIDVDYERLTLYRGNYEKFVKKKLADKERIENEIAKREKEIADHQSYVRRFRAQANKARQAQSKIKRMERIVIPSLPKSSRRYPRMTFPVCRPSGRNVVSLEGVSKAFGDNKVLDNVEMTVERGDRLAVIGPNGIGKSTLLKILAGSLNADTGEVEWGYETHPGYFAQDHQDILEHRQETVLSWLWKKAPGQPIGFVLGHLARLLFNREDAEKGVNCISGGEAARLVFARLSLTKPNVLILDEPTNHLDLEGIEALSDALMKYEGTILFVSHDRWFVSRLANRIMELTLDGPVSFKGTYEEYLAHCGDDHLDVNTVVQREKKKKKKANYP